MTDENTPVVSGQKKIAVREAVIVEGRYDKIRLSSLIDGLIITTEGFGIFKDAQKMRMLRHLAVTRGLLVITDSDSAGFVIRNHLRSRIPEGRVIHAYIPDVVGKERRKASPSKEGKLGVEGMTTEALVEALERAGVVCGEAPPQRENPITGADFYRLGLSGASGSSALRARLLEHLGLPSRMTSKALLGVINEYMTRDELLSFVNDKRH